MSSESKPRHPSTLLTQAVLDAHELRLAICSTTAPCGWWRIGELLSLEGRVTFRRRFKRAGVEGQPACPELMYTDDGILSEFPGGGH